MSFIPRTVSGFPSLNLNHILLACTPGGTGSLKRNTNCRWVECGRLLLSKPCFMTAAPRKLRPYEICHRPLIANRDAAARKLMELADGVQASQDGRIYRKDRLG